MIHSIVQVRYLQTLLHLTTLIILVSITTLLCINFTLHKILLMLGKVVKYTALAIVYLKFIAFEMLAPRFLKELEKRGVLYERCYWFSRILF